ncbi:MAG: GNAT family N-acetyltransferase [Candidatus Phosphoribacter sp.]
MHIRPIEFDDDATLRQMYDVVTASRAHERPHFVPSSADAVIADLRHDDPGETVLAWGLWEGNVLAGVTTACLTLNDNRDIMWVEVDVDPGHRRRGLGRAAVEHLVAFAREQGRTRLLTDARYPADRADGHPYLRFAESCGFRLAQTEIMRKLDLPVDTALLAEIADEARAAYEPHYRVEAYAVVPEGLRASLCDCMNRVGTDAPTGEIDVEPESMDPERYAGWLTVDAEGGRARLTSLAIEQASGDVVAYTELALPAGNSRVHQWGTLVQREHRGHRLGLAVKAANLLALQADHPDRLDVITGNAHDNPWMVSINERLGFRPLELNAAFHRAV